MSTPGLPSEFADLLPYLSWALPTEAARMQLRLRTPMPEIVAFYRTVQPRMDELADHLGRWPLDSLPEALRPLLRLGLMYMEAAASVELFHSPDVPESLPASQLTVYTEGYERTWGQA